MALPSGQITNSRGFALIELLVVVIILVVLMAITIPSMISFQKTPQLNNSFEEVVNALRVAQNKTISSEENSQYGVYFNTATVPHQYILFKGASYALRDSAYDQVKSISNLSEFYDINTGGGNQIVFDKLTGFTANFGNVSLRLKEDTSQTKIIYIDNSGIISAAPLSVPPDDARTKDSRHIDFDYNRVIDTGTENMVLTFNGNVIQTIPMAQYTASGKFDWEGTFNVTGTDQVVRVHTLRLNSPDTQFSVFRDRRFNDKSLTVKLSGDVTGTLVEYSADGLTTDFHSIYVNNLAWQ